MDREAVNKIRGYDEKIIGVKEDWLKERDPLLSVTCGKGLQLQNYRCCQYTVHCTPSSSLAHSLLYTVKISVYRRMFCGELSVD